MLLYIESHLIALDTSDHLSVSCSIRIPNVRDITIPVDSFNLNTLYRQRGEEKTYRKRMFCETFSQEFKDN